MSYIDRCKCGHDITTHFRDPTTRKLHGCLGMRCDCPVYIDRDSPEPRTRVAPPPPPPDSDVCHVDDGWVCVTLPGVSYQVVQGVISYVTVRVSIR